MFYFRTVLSILPFNSWTLAKCCVALQFESRDPLYTCLCRITSNGTRQVFSWKTNLLKIILLSAHSIFYKTPCAPSEDSDQSVHQSSLIRDLAGHSPGSKCSKSSSGGQRILWSDCADAQADLSIHWSHIQACWKWRTQAKLLLQVNLFIPTDQHWQIPLQTVSIQMRRLVTSRLIWIYTVCHSIINFLMNPYLQ